MIDRPRDSVAMNSSRRSPQLDVAIIGAGLAGLYAAYRLRGLGLKARVYEAGSAIGGTWFWNRYPGARCDIESLEYSYSFSNELQQEWSWPDRYATQPQILAYINHVADRFDLRRDIQLNARITSAVFSPGVNRWWLECETGETISAQFCVMATGNLSTPRVPDLGGLDRFRGHWYHTGLWPKKEVHFSGERVGVIGTGSTGIQVIPLVAKQSKHLFVFQRTPNFSIPARNAPMDPEMEREHKSTYPERRKAAYETSFGVSGYPAPTMSALAASPEERHKKFEELWARGGTVGFLTCYSDLLLDEEANEMAAEFVRRKIRMIVRSPAVAEMLAPKDHPIGSKRLCLDTDYYETYNRDNVTLVDVRSAPIQEITARGLRTTNGEYELDSIVFATGFDAITGALREIDIRVEGGPTLEDLWAAGPRTYLGLMVAGVPNMFLVTGPGSPGVKSQMVLSIEQHVDWIANCLEHVTRNAFARVEAEPEAQDRWVRHVNDVANSTLYPRANSWYVGANIPGKPRIFMPYVGGVAAYKRKCDQVAANNYEGFEISR